MVSLLIYLAELSLILKIVFGIVAACLFCFFIVFIMCIGVEELQELKERDKNIMRKFLISTLIFLSLFILTPSDTTLYLIAANKFLTKSELPEKAKMALEKKLDEIIGANK